MLGLHCHSGFSLDVAAAAAAKSLRSYPILCDRTVKGRIVKAKGCLAQGDFGTAVVPLWEDSAQKFSLTTLTFFGFEAPEPLSTTGGPLCETL